MRKLDHFSFAKEVTGASTSNAWYNGCCADTLTLTIDGTASAFSVKVQGLSDLNGTFMDLFVLAVGGAMTEVKSCKAITEKGIYVLDVTGFEKIRTVISSVTGGNLTIYGAATSEV